MEMENEDLGLNSEVWGAAFKIIISEMKRSGIALVRTLEKADVLLVKTDD